jgi:hypothetical protein
MEEEKVVEEPKKEKKKGKGLMKFLVFLIFLAAIVISLGYLFPGLIWTKSLGVNYTTEDYNSIMNKLNYIKDSVPTGDLASNYEYKYGEVTNINVEFTSEELTAFFNENRPSYYAIKNVEIKINEDGTIEAVANASVDYFLNEFMSGKYSRDQIKEEIPALGLLPKTVNLYVKFSGSVLNNSSSASINTVAVQGITIPSNLINSSEAINIVTTGCNNLMSTYNSKTGSTFNKIAIEDSKIKFEGSVPSSLERIKK